MRVSLNRQGRKSRRFYGLEVPCGALAAWTVGAWLRGGEGGSLRRRNAGAVNDVQDLAINCPNQEAIPAGAL